jgi:hypothetical protein
LLLVRRLLRVLLLRVLLLWVLLLWRRRLRVLRRRSLSGLRSGLNILGC